MKKIYLVPIVLLFLLSCRTSRTDANEELIFKLKATECMGPCPAFELEVYESRDFYFNAVKNISVSGEFKEQFSKDRYDAFLGLLRTVQWDSFKPKYASNLMDLPTKNYFYNVGGASISIEKYGVKPKELEDLSEMIVAFMIEEVE